MVNINSEVNLNTAFYSLRRVCFAFKYKINITLYIYFVILRTGKTPSKGKENKNVPEKKRVYKDDDEDDEEDSEPKQLKKRRLIIPDVESGDDSEDEFKPGSCCTYNFSAQLCNFVTKYPWKFSCRSPGGIGRI